MATITHRREQIMTASGLDALAGIWLLLSPFILRFLPGAAVTNNVLVGIVIAILAIIRFSGAYEQAWISWINAILGVWVLISPWVLQFADHRVPTTNNVITGIVVIILATWSALATDASRRGMRGDYGAPSV